MHLDQVRALGERHSQMDAGHEGDHPLRPRKRLRRVTDGNRAATQRRGRRPGEGRPRRGGRRAKEADPLQADGAEGGIWIRNLHEGLRGACVHKRIFETSPCLEGLWSHQAG